MIKATCTIAAEEIGKDKASRIAEAAQKRYEELLNENRSGSKALRAHTFKRIYLGIAVCEAFWEEILFHTSPSVRTHTSCDDLKQIYGIFRTPGFIDLIDPLIFPDDLTDSCVIFHLNNEITASAKETRNLRLWLEKRVIQFSEISTKRNLPPVEISILVRIIYNYFLTVSA